MSDDLERRELQPLREYLEELGEAALPAVREYLERHGLEAREKPKPIEWRLPGDPRANLVPIPASMLQVRVVGTGRTTPNGAFVAGVLPWRVS